MKKLFLFAIPIIMAACVNQTPKERNLILKSGIDPAAFDTTMDGKKVSLYVLANKAGMEIAITNYGGRIVSVMSPDKEGHLADIVLGFDNIHDYVNIDNNFGALIGRYANRIAKGRFVLDGKEYLLEKNNGENHLHGGSHGFHTKVWDVVQASDSIIVLHYLSKDMEAGYPGNLDVHVTYTLTEDNALHISYAATTDKTTIVNLTNHSYFNLKGAGEGNILDHILTIHAKYFTPVGKDLIPTGVIMPVAGTPFDFRQPEVIGKRINDDNPQLVFGHGYDHNWVLKIKASDSLVLAAKVLEPVSGRTLEVYTIEPGLQVYTGNFLDGTVKGKKGKVYPFRGAICLETQHFPDSPNKPDFPSVVLQSGKAYHSYCIFRFGVEKK
ncbi:MAG: galactose mutarotase [Chlorobi bacterium]|nr:galactose mutarotase [Chlorobiota bacterium]